MSSNKILNSGPSFHLLFDLVHKKSRNPAPTIEADRRIFTAGSKADIGALTTIHKIRSLLGSPGPALACPIKSAGRPECRGSWSSCSNSSSSSSSRLASSFKSSINGTRGAVQHACGLSVEKSEADGTRVLAEQRAWHNKAQGQRRAGQIADALATLQQGLQQFPDDRWVVVDTKVTHGRIWGMCGCEKCNSLSPAIVASDQAVAGRSYFPRRQKPHFLQRCSAQSHVWTACLWVVPAFVVACCKREI
eukprot:1159724-Pelagomonas_calceolata.AAC.13